uniref:Uncharacterized protein n=1 Tax=Candidatus Kentrum eta TaxID=2126337 RepID=A0A450V9Q9_9GAMM|nr:MAG: hypothetical protein BECKH772A_GA0070896_102294 [Candidatus Kentron sp. H]VFK01531.1 MAG: hypothetical protein BECKH772B_GA0070898_102365 [Candidatus Kentron sp. H]VFK05063.1 MAG: hypothetical protein BECKH772C_GA0070978_102335 [Candidatus Kentron sp. H]
MDWFKVKHDRRLMKCLTGLTAEEFESLLPTFEAALISEPEAEKTQSGHSGSRKGVLRTSEEKLFFILSRAFDVDRFRPCRWVQKLLPVLEMALGHRSFPM